MAMSEWGECDYQEMAIEALKQFGQQLMEDAEVLISASGLHRETTIWIRIPSFSGNEEAPTMEVSQEFVPSNPVKLFFGVKED